MVEEAEDDSDVREPNLDAGTDSRPLEGRWVPFVLGVVVLGLLVFVP